MPSATNVPRANFQMQEKENRGRAAGYAEFNFLLTAHVKVRKFENKTIIKSRITFHMREILQGTPATNVPRANFQVQEKEKRGRAAEYDEFNFLLTAFQKSASMIATLRIEKSRT